MRRISVCLAFLSVCLFVNPYASATWSSLKSTGAATGIGTPSCAEFAASKVVCAVRSGKSALMVNTFNASTWSGWANLPGTAVTVASDPSCTNNGAGHVFCAATAANGSLVVTTYNGTAWTTPTTVAGSLYSAPSCAGYKPGEVLCVARNSTGGLAWTLYNGTSWSAFANLSTTTVSNPSCTNDDNGGVICAAFTTAYVTEVDRYDGAWQGFLKIGGIAGGEPDCAAWNSGGKVTCFAKAYNSGIYGSTFNGGSWVAGNWPPYAGIGGSVNDNASCTSHIAGELVCGVTATDSNFWANVWNGAAWSGWQKVAGTTVGSPSCAPLGNGQVVCVIMTPSNKLTSTVGP